MANIPKVWNGTAFIELEAAATVAPAASTTVVGIVQLTDSTSSTSTTTAATPNSVKSAFDLAGSANTTAGTAIPKDTVTAEGDILYASGSATVARLGIGTADQVLGIAAGVPAWTTPAAGGGMTLIATGTPSAATSLVFSSIPGTYKHLLLVWDQVFGSVVSGYWSIRLNNDDTSSIYTNQTMALQFASSWTGGAGTDTKIGRSTTQRLQPIGGSGNSSTAYDEHANGGIWIYRYAETTAKTFRWWSCGRDQSANYLSEGWGNYRGTAVITSIDFIRSSTQTITGNFYLYGVS